ncbi:PAS domain-containing protein [Flavobacteriaceae bacterium D16]|nr:PAS domain-containing protein [Flavobacteriaceae bacterium D16]
MQEIKNFDKAAEKYYTKLKFNSLPLLSWDIFGQHYQKISAFFNDLADFSVIAKHSNWKTHSEIKKALLEKDQIVIVTDPELNIVKASHNIFHMNGYSQEEIIGQKPKIFQGPDTCKQTTQYISKAIQQQKSFETTVLNYRKDGSAYKCWIKGEPVFNKKGKVVHFIAYEKEVA